jgi:drug/metabolite transporter (DMT)-like permease
MTDKARGTAEMIIAMLISGTIGWFVVMSGRPVLDVVFWRCAIGTVALLGLCAATGAVRTRLTWTQFIIAVAGGVAIVLNWLLLFASYSHASIAIATAVYNTQPFMLLGFGALFFGERITAAKVLWLLVAFAGLLLIISTKPQASYIGSSYGLGILMALSAAFGWAIAAITTKKLKGVAPQRVALIHVATGTLMLAPFISFGSLPQAASTWSMLITLGLVHTGLMYALMYSAVQKLPTHLQGALSFIYPVVAVLVDVLALGHQLNAVQIFGSATILVAAAGMSLGWTWRNPVANLFRRAARDRL